MFLDKLLDNPNSSWLGYIYPWGSILMRDRKGLQPEFECWSSEVIAFGSIYFAMVDPIMKNYLVMRPRENPKFGDLINRSALRMTHSSIARVVRNGELKICAIPVPHMFEDCMDYKPRWLEQEESTEICVSKTLVDTQVVLVKLSNSKREIGYKIFKFPGKRVYKGRQKGKMIDDFAQPELIPEEIRLVS